jgi:hypothetical protein
MSSGTKAFLSALTSFAGVLAIMGVAFMRPEPAQGIPAFARKYGLPCSACHEAWPKLNSFGQNFRDNGYQLMNDRDAPVYQNPSYWPIAMRITPHWHYESTSRMPQDAVPGDATSGTVDRHFATNGFDLTGIDILTGGTLSKNISFLLVPSIDPGDGTIGFESAWVRLDNVFGSRWLNVKFGKHELDLPLSEKRMMTLTNTGGGYQLYHFTPVGDVNDFSFGENQLGVELSGHSRNSYTRYAASLVSNTNGDLGLSRGRTYGGYVHVSQGVTVPKLGLQRFGAYAFVGSMPTYFLTFGGEPIPGGGRGDRSFYRMGAYTNLYFGKFDVTGVWQHALDNAFFGTATPGTTALPPGSQSPTWNTGTIEAHYTYSPQLFLIGRYETVRMSRQAFTALPGDFGNTDAWTVGYRWYPIMSSRAGFAWHNEFSTARQRLTSTNGLDVRSNSILGGFDFAF